LGDRPRIYVLAGVNEGGKSSIGGAAFRAYGADYYNPDEIARELSAEQPGLTLAEANAMAWQTGRALLERAIRERLDFAFETTLGGNTIPRLLAEAAKSGIGIESCASTTTAIIWIPRPAGCRFRDSCSIWKRDKSSARRIYYKRRAGPGRSWLPLSKIGPAEPQLTAPSLPSPARGRPSLRRPSPRTASARW
jgi:hypothetical protein